MLSRACWGGFTRTRIPYRLFHNAVSLYSKRSRFLWLAGAVSASASVVAMVTAVNRNVVLAECFDNPFKKSHQGSEVAAKTDEKLNYENISLAEISHLPVVKAELTVAPNVPAPLNRSHSVLLKVDLETTVKEIPLSNKFNYVGQ